MKQSSTAKLQIRINMLVIQSVKRMHISLLTDALFRTHGILIEAIV